VIKLPPWLAKHLPDQALAFDISVIFGGFSLQLITQMGWLLLAVRTLGPDGYGIFASLTGLTVAIGCFVGWGSGALLTRGVAAHPETLRDWMGHGLIAITVTALLFGALASVALPLVNFGPVVGRYLIAVLIADLLFGRMASLCVNIHMATGNSRRQSSVTVITGTTRLVAIALAAVTNDKLTLTIWVWWYLASSALGAAICLGQVVREHGWPHWRWMGASLREGFTFSAETAVQSALKDLDKPIVLQLLGATAAGHYATAFRVTDTLVMPLYALAYATYGKMFRKAAVSVAECLAYALKLLPLALAMGAAVGVGALVGAGLLPLVFGRAYYELPWLVLMLSPMPILLGVFMLGADALSATGHQSKRLLLVSVSLAATLLALPWAIEQAGLVGAVLVRLGASLVTAGAVWMLLPWSDHSWRQGEGRN